LSTHIITESSRLRSLLRRWETTRQKYE